MVSSMLCYLFVKCVCDSLVEDYEWNIIFIVGLSSFGGQSSGNIKYKTKALHGMCELYKRYKGYINTLIKMACKNLR